MKCKLEPIEITVISVHRGLIQLIEPDGAVAVYRQLGIERYRVLLNRLIWERILDPTWQRYDEIPEHYKLSYEAPEIMGKRVPRVFRVSKAVLSRIVKQQ